MTGKNRFRVGVVTLSSHFNYGNRLQAHASVQMYKKCGLMAELLELTPRFRLKREAAKLIRRSVGRYQLPPERMMSDARKEAFSRFDRNIPSRTLTKLYRGLTDEYNVFSVGSDQTWNPSQFAYNDNLYFLKFAHEKQRIALAPSIGVAEVSSKQGRRMARGILGFPSISVREQAGAEIIRRISGRNAEVICDPTLVLSPEEWRAVASDRLTPEDPYVFSYLLGGVGESVQWVLDEVTDRGRLPIIALSDRQEPGELDAGPAEFISLVDNAVHVVTDSFHAAVFSSILRTPLTIVRREGGTSMFSRLETLSKTLGIQHKIYGSPDFDLSRAGDYRGVPEAIESERKKFMDYLEKCLDAQLPGWRDDARV